MNSEQLLRPSMRPKAPGDLNQCVWQQIQQIQNEKKMKKRFFRRWAAVAAVVVGLGVSLPLILVSSVNAASEQVISESIEQLVAVQNFRVDFKIRTEPNENFAAIDPVADFITGSFVCSFDKPNSWYIGYDQGRTAVFTGDSVFVWLNGSALGFCGDAQVQSGVLEPFSVLLEPQKMLRRELSMIERQACQASMVDQGGLVTLTLETPATGNFENPYMLNTSVDEAYSRRTYVFDQKTKLLQAFSVEVIDKGSWVRVLQSERIAYNQPLDVALWRTPSNLTWRNIQATYTNPSLTGISAQRAVELILEATERSDMVPVKEAVRFYDPQAIKAFYGLKILSVGEPFESGSYAGVFVPCRVKLKNGQIKEYRLAMRNDNPSKVWTLDGGI